MVRSTPAGRSGPAIVAVLAAAWLLAQALPVRAAAPDAAIDAAVEKLWFNQKALARVDGDLHAVAWHRLNGPDLALARLQRVELHVAQARIIARHQWELLATVDYIREAARSDFFTLRYRGLHRAVKKSRDLLALIDLYGGSIEDATARQALSHGRGLIEGNIYLFETLIDILKPHVNEGTTPYSGIWAK